MSKTKSIEVLLLVIIVAIAAVAYRFGYVSYTEKAKALQNKNKVTEARIAELQGKLEAQPIYEAGIVEAAEIEEAVKKNYAAKNTPEKSTMFIVELEEETGTSVSSISFGSDSNIFSSSAVDENGVPKLMAYKSQLTLAYSTTYDGLKAIFNRVGEYPERMNVDNFSASFDSETGLITGSMVLNLFSITAEGMEYEEPVVGGISIGTDNIFGR